MKHRAQDPGDGFDVPESLAALGEDLAAARSGYEEVKKLDETLFTEDFETL